MKGERRAVARYRAKLPVEIEMGGHKFENAASIEISLAGIRIACNGPVAGRILHQYIQVTPGENITANIQIKIPEATGLVNNIHCRTRVISVNRASQARYIVGLKFLEFDGYSQLVWTNYISKIAN